MVFFVTQFPLSRRLAPQNVFFQKVIKKPMLCVLHLIGVPHSPADSISVHCKLLRKFIVKLHADRRSYRKRHTSIQTPSEGGVNSEVLAEVSLLKQTTFAAAEVAWNWPQCRVSHAQKEAIVHDFRSVTSTQALKSITCASCSERVRHDKQCVRLVSHSLYMYCFL